MKPSPFTQRKLSQGQGLFGNNSAVKQGGASEINQSTQKMQDTIMVNQSAPNKGSASLFGSKPIQGAAPLLGTQEQKAPGGLFGGKSGEDKQEDKPVSSGMAS
jgi:hypothetical protein